MSYEQSQSGQRQVQGYIRELDGFLQERGLLQQGQSVASMGHNDTLDAYRHSYVMGRISMDLNRAVAITAGRNHENEVANDPAERRMDLHNNAIGAGFGWELREQGISSPRALFLKIEQGIEDGKLILYPEQEKPRVGQLRSSIDGASSDVALGNESANRQFAQALKGANGDRDAAAVAVNAIREAGGKPDQDISVVQGKNGLIVSQGQGDAALNVPVPQAKAGDFERVAAQMAQQPAPTQQVAMQPETQERKAPTV